jgi:hypothetical protein
LNEPDPLPVMLFFWLIPVLIALAVVVALVFLRLQQRVRGGHRKEGQVLKDS